VRALCVLVAMVGIAVASPKNPSPAQKQADALFVKGQASYEAGKYQDAIAQFKEAYELVKDPVFLFNIAQSYRKVADCTASAEYYKRFLDEAPQAENRQKVEQWIAELRPCVEERQRQDEAARKNQEEAERLRKERELAERQRAAAPPREVTVDRGGPLRIGGLVLAGIGVVGLGAGVAYGIKGNSLRNDIEDQCSAPNSCQWDSPPIQAKHEDGKTANVRSKIGYIGGGIAAVAGAALYMLGRTRVETVTVQPTASGATVSARLSF